MTAITNIFFFGSHNIHDKLYHSNQLKVNHLIKNLKLTSSYTNFNYSKNSQYLIIKYKK
jgi:hypothetical protein